MLHKRRPYAKSSLTFLCLIKNMYPHVQRLQAIKDVLAFFPLKETRNLSLLPGIVIDQRVLLNWLVIRENLIFFLPSSLFPQWRGHWWEQEYITKRSLEFLLGLFKKLHPTQVHKTSHFTKDIQCLKIENQETAENTYCFFQKKKVVFKCKKNIRIYGLRIIASLLFSSFIFPLEWPFVLIYRVQVRYYGCGLTYIGNISRLRIDL